MCVGCDALNVRSRTYVEGLHYGDSRRSQTQASSLQRLRRCTIMQPEAEVAVESIPFELPLQNDADVKEEHTEEVDSAEVHVETRQHRSMAVYTERVCG